MYCPTPDATPERGSVKLVQKGVQGILAADPWLSLRRAAREVRHVRATGEDSQGFAGHGCENADVVLMFLLMLMLMLMQMLMLTLMVTEIVMVDDDGRRRCFRAMDTGGGRAQSISSSYPRTAAWTSGMVMVMGW